MKIHLKSGNTFECEDEWYVETNNLSGELTYIFVSISDQKKYTVDSECIEYFEADLDNGDLEELAMYGEYREECSCSDPSVG